jgi:hypothetical protein
VAGAVTLAVLVVAWAPSVVAAASQEPACPATPVSAPDGGAVLERANSLIFHQIEVAQHVAEKTPVDDAAVAERLVAFADRTVERAVRMLGPDTVEVVYVEVEVGEATVSVDPMKVAGG